MTQFNVRLIDPNSNTQLLKVEFVPDTGMDVAAFNARIKKVVEMMPVGSLQNKDELEVVTCKDLHTTLFFKPWTKKRGLDMYWEVVGIVTQVHENPKCTFNTIEYEGDVTQLMYTSMTFTRPA
jgi:hypothetical protein